MLPVLTNKVLGLNAFRPFCSKENPRKSTLLSCVAFRVGLYIADYKEKIGVLLTEESETLQQRKLREDMHQAVSEKYVQIFDENPFLHL